VEVLWRVVGIAYAEITIMRRQWMWIAQNFMWTISFLVLFTAWGGFAAVKHLIVVIIVIGGWSTGLNAVAQSIGWDRVSGEYERRIASPLSPLEYILGLTIGYMLVFNLPNLAVTLGIALYMGMSVEYMLMLFGLSVLALFTGLFLSLSIILRIKNPMNISAVTNPLNTLTIFLPPVYYPATLLPAPLKTLCMIVPTTAMVDLGRALGGLPHAYPVEASIAVVSAWLAVAGIFTKKKLKWGLE